MNIIIPNQYDNFIKGQVSSGKFHSADEVISAALDIMQKDLGTKSQQLSWLQSKLEASWEQMESGDVITSSNFENNG